MSGHGRTICSCGRPITTCKCPGPHEPDRVVERGCTHCQSIASKTPQTYKLMPPSPRDAQWIALKFLSHQTKRGRSFTPALLADICDAALAGQIHDELNGFDLLDPDNTPALPAERVVRIDPRGRDDVSVLAECVGILASSFHAMTDVEADRVKHVFDLAREIYDRRTVPPPRSPPPGRIFPWDESTKRGPTVGDHTADGSWRGDKP